MQPKVSKGYGDNGFPAGAFYASNEDSNRIEVFQKRARLRFYVYVSFLCQSIQAQNSYPLESHENSELSKPEPPYELLKASKKLPMVPTIWRNRHRALEAHALEIASCIGFLSLGIFSCQPEVKPQSSKKDLQQSTYLC